MSVIINEDHDHRWPPERKDWETTNSWVHGELGESNGGSERLACPPGTQYCTSPANWESGKKYFWGRFHFLRDKHWSENLLGGSRQTLSWSTHFDAPRLPDDQDVILWLRYNVITSFVFVATLSSSSLHWSARHYLVGSIPMPPHCPKGDIMVIYGSHQKE